MGSQKICTLPMCRCKAVPNVVSKMAESKDKIPVNVNSQKFQSGSYYKPKIQRLLEVVFIWVNKVLW